MKQRQLASEYDERLISGYVASYSWTIAIKDTIKEVISEHLPSVNELISQKNNCRLCMEKWTVVGEDNWILYPCDDPSNRGTTRHNLPLRLTGKWTVVGEDNCILYPCDDPSNRGTTRHNLPLRLTEKWTVVGEDNWIPNPCDDPSNRGRPVIGRGHSSPPLLYPTGKRVSAYLNGMF
ncbi:hypothetical protein AVEN_139068-1 [Araneus ventricosus]|uniref:Uncharacterized protein n=1 Tax=Araneus ventricosus TaxID=182803 RepID=A0A4Y2LP10_ARAVE|nr:hypothetical protein AVEN_139068-1 [Araneus ventricosus]